MRIDAIRIENYKGFYDSGWVPLHPKWNVIVGQNNAGKTAFMEGFQLSGNRNNPHRDNRFPIDHLWPPRSKISARMKIHRQWLLKAWLRNGGQFHLPVLNDGRSKEELIEFWDGDEINAEIDFFQGEAVSAWPSHKLFAEQDEKWSVFFDTFGDLKIGSISNRNNNANDSLPNVVHQERNKFLYLFDAKRAASGTCAHGASSKLNSDASNLPEALHSLMGNPHLFEEYKERVREIFPTIKSITVPPHNQNRLEIRIWPVEESARRVDLSVPLNESGSGIGQVLSILYVAMNADPSVIGIDEPNSFLHPGAAKALIQILKRYDKHQYIISTHSPEVIGVAQPAALHLIRNDGTQSTVQTFNETTIDDLRMMLEEVGASISDVFSVDRVVYVEGPTEKECFDVIVRRERGGDVVGFAFVALRNTGDFEGRSDTKAVLGIYDALSRGGSILPAKVAFSFDSEGKDQGKIAELKRRCNGKGFVLPRRMTENYLLSPAAIASVLTNLEFREVTAEQVEASLRKHGPDHMALKVPFEYASESYFREVHGGRLIRSVFNEISEARISYDKVRHGVMILKAILDVDSSSVEELVEYVNGIVESTA